MFEELTGSVGYDLKVLNKDPETYTAQFNCFELTLPADVVHGCYHSGPCDADIENCRLLPEVIKGLAGLDPEKLKDELEEYGAWDETELSNHDENLNRIIWIACGDIQEGR